MDRQLLRRAQWGTLGGGVAVGLLVALVWTFAHGVGTLAGAAWAALNLRVLEGLIGEAVVPHDAPRSLTRLFLWGIAKLGVYGLAFWILIVRPFPAVGMVVGLTIMLMALVLAGLTSRSAVPREATRRGDDADA